MRRALFSTLCLLMAVTLAPRCGLKASPVPYPLAKPVAINDLTALARGNGVMLSWTIPDKNTDGTALKDIKGFNLVRSAIPIKDIDTGKKEVYKQWRYDYRPGERYTTVKDMDLNYRVRYSYLVFTVTKNDIVSDSSNTAVVSWDKPFLKPSGIRAKSGDHFVELSWLSPTAYIDGSRINKTVYYNVYRSPKMGDFPLFPINPALISGTTYIDGDLKNDVPYFYEVTSVSKVHDTPIESVPSSQIIAVPADLVSPARPYGVSAAPLNGGIALSWEPNTESNVMGYYVYRESGNGKGFVRVNARPISGTTYVDTGARTGYTTYHITAVDDSRQHNESAPSENYTILYRRGR
ncbi:MAG: hypothetical protein M1491_05655 [Deltaproteobacteria bacterium]|nr:hypothetical protein [Deltaproteobacteria bacterium]MCL5276380.1 hypothetical protein [Deltaproteobacteria bacterium]